MNSEYLIIELNGNNNLLTVNRVQSQDPNSETSESLRKLINYLSTTAGTIREGTPGHFEAVEEQLKQYFRTYP